MHDNLSTNGISEFTNLKIIDVFKILQFYCRIEIHLKCFIINPLFLNYITNNISSIIFNLRTNTCKKNQVSNIIASILIFLF